MENSNISKLTKVFREIFLDDAIDLVPETSPDSIEAWDSVMHINLIMGIEEEFGVRFATGDIIKMTSVGKILEEVEAKCA